MATLTPAEWKRFYAAERAKLGRPRLDEMIERAETIALDLRHAAVFPHTRLEITGESVAAVAKAVVESGAGEVLAIGVLHGAPSRERRVHGAGEASTQNEFSLDAFEVLLSVAADRARRERPRVHARYPLLVGTEPKTLPGIEELTRLAERMPTVATTDPVHHGIGYGDDTEHALASSAAVTFARDAIGRQLRALEVHDFSTFQTECASVRSDFRDAGPALALAVGLGAKLAVRRLDLVDYAEALGSPAPTWVAGALISTH